jgi:hypothetical protein
VPGFYLSQRDRLNLYEVLNQDSNPKVLSQASSWKQAAFWRSTSFLQTNLEIEVPELFSKLSSSSGAQEMVNIIKNSESINEVAALGEAVLNQVRFDLEKELKHQMSRKELIARSTQIEKNVS